MDVCDNLSAVIWDSTTVSFVLHRPFPPQLHKSDFRAQVQYVRLGPKRSKRQDRKRNRFNGRVPVTDNGERDRKRLGGCLAPVKRECEGGEPSRISLRW